MLAIVIPYYKLTFFEETLQSLANQTDKRFKVYIGNDASLQDPSLLIEKYKNRFDFKYHHFEENLGGISLTKQWGRCINLTKKEDWILLLGDDDYLSPNFVEEFYNNIDEINSLKINVVHFSIKVLNVDKLSKKYNHPKIEKSTDSFFRKFFEGSHGSLSEQIFRRTAYLEKGFRDIPLAWGADDIAWLEFSNFGYIFGINNANATFRISSENISRSGFESSLKKKSKHFLFKIITENYFKKFTKEQRLKLILHYQSLCYRYNLMTIRILFKLIKFLYFEKEYSSIFKYLKKYLKHLINKVLF